MTKKLEQTQYSAALAVTSAWRGTNRQRLYEELGWEKLYDRRWYRRLCHFYSLKMSATPQYLFEEIPPEPISLTICDMRGSMIKIFQELFAFQIPTSRMFFMNGICLMMESKIRLLLGNSKGKSWP